MKLHNTRSKQTEDVTLLDENTVRIYSCGPTVYDHIHIGNLSSFIFADTLRRVIAASFPQRAIKHTMNFTDVDDKTIRRSRETYPELDPMAALLQHTQHFSELFLRDMDDIGNDVAAVTFIKATDSIEGMKQLIGQLYDAGYAYLAEDGVYFSISKYRESDKTYGQLLEISEQSTANARIQNDEYDKDSPHDFALWKKQKAGEPAWELSLTSADTGEQVDLTGRPGWHIECSVMSRAELGQPFDIHTGGIDLIFPHHENEIAQSTALETLPLMAQYFVHNEHLLVDGKKMSKSLSNFFTLSDITAKGFEPLAFRLMMLQAQYRSQTNFTWDNLEAAQNRLRNYQAVADLRFQTVETATDSQFEYEANVMRVLEQLQNDMNTPQALSIVSELFDHIATNVVHPNNYNRFTSLIDALDALLGLQLSVRTDINEDQKRLLGDRQAARANKDWTKSDTIRDELAAQGIGVRDTPHGAIWFRL